MAKDNKKILPYLEPALQADSAGAPLPPDTEHLILPQLTAEQQAEVDQLAGKIAGTETPAGAAAEEIVATQSIPSGSFQDDASMCVDVFVESAIAYCPKVEPLWPADKRRNVAVALGRVFEKYNFSFARFGPEIALVAIAGPVLWQTSKVIAQQMNEQAAVAVQAVQVHAPVPTPDNPAPTA
jgi:hypothetical protein